MPDKFLFSHNPCLLCLFFDADIMQNPNLCFSSNKKIIFMNRCFFCFQTTAILNFIPKLICKTYFDSILGLCACNHFYLAPGMFRGKSQDNGLGFDIFYYKLIEKFLLICLLIYLGKKPKQKYCFFKNYFFNSLIYHVPAM